MNLTEICKHDPNVVPISQFQDHAALTAGQEEYLNYLATVVIYSMVEMRTDVDKPLGHLQEEAYLRGRLDLLLELKLNSTAVKNGRSVVIPESPEF